MKNLKTKLVLLVLLGICFGSFIISFVNANINETKYLNPSPYGWASFGKELNNGDDIVIDIQSDDTINIYIMNEQEYSIWEFAITYSAPIPPQYPDFIMRWVSTTILEYTYKVSEDDIYYVLIYNTDSVHGRIVDVKITYNIKISGYPILLLGLALGIITIPLIFKLRKKTKQY